METLSIFIVDVLKTALEGPRWIRWPLTAAMLLVVGGLLAAVVWVNL
ncbi:hypothetical protein [Sphingomonas sp.]|nr:hypothetical protein [Sphingomonas sp.]MBO9712083.1 hypothetical protein [Sphingomonas sp.]